MQKLFRVVVTNLEELEYMGMEIMGKSNQVINCVVYNNSASKQEFFMNHGIFLGDSLGIPAYFG